MQGMMEDLGGNICEIKVRYNLGINILVNPRFHHDWF